MCLIRLLHGVRPGARNRAFHFLRKQARGILGARVAGMTGMACRGRSGLGIAAVLAIAACGAEGSAGQGADALDTAVESEAIDGAGDVSLEIWAEPVEISAEPVAEAAAEVAVDVSAEVAADVAGTGPVRFAVVSDTHLMPDPTHANDVRWAGVMDSLAAVVPALDFVFSTGDNIDDLYATLDFAQAFLDGGDPLPMMVVFQQLIADHPVPLRLVPGNHDDRFFDTFLGNDVPRAVWHKVFGATDRLPNRWYSVQRGGCLFVVLDSTDLATTHEDNDTPTFGAEQLAWLDGELSRGLPAVVFWHHFIPMPDDVTPLNPVLPVLQAHRDVVKATFTGHGHEFRKYAWEGIRFYETAALKDPDPPAIHRVECDGATGVVTVTNEADITYVP